MTSMAVVDVHAGGAASGGLCCRARGATDDGSAGMFGVGEGVLGELSLPGEVTGRLDGSV